MTIRRDRKKPRQGTKPAATPPAEGPAAAEAALAAGHFREAIERFKALARTDPPAVWQAGMAAAYRGRALEHQAKGMLKEALTIWDNREQACPGLTPDPRHLTLLLRLGRGEAALAAYRRLVQGGPPPTLAEARALFAAELLVSELPGSLARDPTLADDPLARDTPIAQAALAAWCAGDEDALALQLKAIPFRSPYRDLASLLRALSGLAGDPAASGKSLERVSADSPFAPLAEALRLALLPDEELFKALGGASEPLRDFVMTLRGWPEARRQLWRELQRLYDKPGPGAKPNASLFLNLVRRHRSALGLTWVRHQTRALALSLYPQRPPAGLDADLLPLDRALFSALVLEHRVSPRERYRSWREVIEFIAPPDRLPPPGSPDALRIALIQRRMADKPGMLKRATGGKVAQELEQSLVLDPDYPPGYLLLIRHYRQVRGLPQARAFLEQALQHWPEDPEILNEALDLAIASDAFKKASGLAKRILDRDPINRRAKHSLFKAHLAHARKQIKRHRQDLAGKELDLALPWAEGESDRGWIALLRFMTRGLQDPADRETLARICNQLGGGLTGRLPIALEADRHGHIPGPFLKSAGLLAVAAPERQDLLAFCRVARALLEDDGETIRPRVWSPFQPALRKFAALPLEAADYETVCETLRLIGPALAEPRLDFANAALKRWPKKPLFVLHQYEAKDILGKSRGGYWANMHHLERALEQARAEGDQRTAHRIETLLGYHTPRGHFDDDFDDDEDFDEDDDFDEGADLDLPDLEPELFIDLLRGVLGPQFREMEKLFGKDVLAGIRRKIAAGEPVDLPPDVIRLLTRDTPDAPSTDPGPGYPSPRRGRVPRLSPQLKPPPQPGPKPRSAPQGPPATKAPSPPSQPAGDQGPPGPDEDGDDPLKGQLELF